MAEEPKTKKDAESEVHNVIAAFEQILEAVPDDRLALEAIFEAYEQAGDKHHALEYLRRLGQAVADERDAEAAPHIIKKLKELGGSDVEVQQIVDQLERILAPKKPVAGERKGAEGRRKAIDISNELSMAWNLLQAGEFTQEEYSSVVHDLSENSSKNIEVPVSVLHVLHDRSYKNLERVLSFLVRDAHLPLIPLASFEIPPATYNILPREFALHRGALVFDVMGADALVAVLNPFDTDLQKEVERAISRKCHFYLVSAADYDQVLESIKKGQTAAKEVKK